MVTLMQPFEEQRAVKHSMDKVKVGILKEEQRNKADS
jgi:hypothetical protein